MNRAEKETFVGDFAKGIQQAQAFALLSFNKINAEQMSNFRLTLRKNNCRVKVVKNTLAKRVLNETTYKDVSKDLNGPTLIVYGAGDPVLATKSIFEWIGKENLDFKVKSGAALGQVMTADKMKALSKLPGKNELFVSFLWCLKSPPTKFLYALQDTPKKLGYALGALKAQKEKA